MHDPHTLAFTIRYPWRKYGKHGKSDWERSYRDSFISIWHVDPERDGTDDSCGWFIRSRHLKASDKALANSLATNEFDNLQHFFPDARDVDEVRSRISCIFSALRRQDRAWFKHPKWHFWHWSIQIHPWQTFRRWMLTRCAGCGKRFSWGYSPISHGWDTPKLKFMRGEVGLYHSECAGCSLALVNPNQLGATWHPDNKVS